MLICERCRLRFQPESCVLVTIGAVTFAARLPHLLVVSVLALMAPSYSVAQLMMRLSPKSERAFDDYIKAAESKLDWQAHIRLDNARVNIVPGAPEPTVHLPGAIIHDWVAAVVVPGATVEQVLAILESYDDYKRLYASQVTASKLDSRQGDRWRVHLELHKRAIFSPILDTEYEVEYRPLDHGRWGMLSHSTKVAEVDDGRVLPVGTGHGYLWRLNAYWLLEQHLDGVYMECRAISLSRDVPAGMGWALKPMITSVPRQSLQETLEATVRALR
jgi:hypothetical protein